MRCRLIAFTLIAALFVGFADGALAQTADLNAVEATADGGNREQARQGLDAWFVASGGRASRADLTRAWYLLGRLMSDADSAEIEYLRAAIDGDGPYASRARLRLGQLHLAKGDLRRAAQHLVQLRSDDPGGVLVAVSWVWTARVAESMGDAEMACDAWARARSSLNMSDPARFEAEQSRSRCEEPARQPGEVVTYTVQLGAFGTEEAAIRLRDGAANIGVAVRVEPPSGGVRVYRVRAGRFGSRESADLLVDRFRREGFDAIAVPEEP